MTLKAALSRARGILAQKAIEDAPLEAELLLRHVLKINRTRLYLDLEQELSPQDEKAFGHLVERRLSGEPSAYIIGNREFYGRDFHVDSNTLIPRPESELLVETALRLASDRPLTIADIGTGCGAVAISLAVNLPGVTIYATDISAPALEVARCNCRKHGVADRIVFLEGDTLKPLPGPVDLIIANLPYVGEPDLRRGGPLSYEPALALNGGKDGLDMIRTLCRQAGRKISNRGLILLEIGQGQAETVTALFQETFPSARIEVASDLAGIERIVCLRLT